MYPHKPPISLLQYWLSLCWKWPIPTVSNPFGPFGLMGWWDRSLFNSHRFGRGFFFDLELTQRKKTKVNTWLFHGGASFHLVANFLGWVDPRPIRFYQWDGGEPNQYRKQKAWAKYQWTKCDWDQEPTYVVWSEYQGFRVGNPYFGTSRAPCTLTNVPSFTTFHDQVDMLLFLSTMVSHGVTWWQQPPYLHWN